MQITLKLPEDTPRTALESLAVEAYRANALTAN
jgi:hypothetical protein